MIPGHLQFGAFRGRILHLGVSGSVAAYKALELSRDLQLCGVHVSATLTTGAQQFLTPLAFRALGIEPVYAGLFEEREEAYGHLQPGQNADALAIVPATANLLAKLSQGLADDMLSCQALAFRGPLLLAPAMNPAMWDAPATQDNVQRIRERGGSVLEPSAGQVACGDQGRGRLPDLLEVSMSSLRLLSPQDLAGKRILITLGPTREHYDPVRFWSNPSSGKMGAALAVAAWLRGAEVHCVCGPNALAFPSGIALDAVDSAREMHQRCLELWPRCDIGCLCAAVADFRPETNQPEKLKKGTLPDGRLRVEFVANPDILKALGERKKPEQRLVGFAAETEPDLAAAARSKIESKNIDLLAANRIDQDGLGFASDQNAVLIMDRRGASQEMPLQSKADIAWGIWDWISRT